MNLMFWKKKATTENSADDPQEKLGDRNVSREARGQESRYQEKSKGLRGETADVSPAHPKRSLIIGASIGVLVLTTIGLTTLKFFLPSPKQDLAPVDTPAIVQPFPLPAKQLIKLPPIDFHQLRKVQANDNQTDIEALKKKNDALQTQIETLKVEPSQAENRQNAIRQAEIENLKKKNEALQSQIGVLKAEIPKLEKAQAEQHEANIDALTKKNDELQAQMEALKKIQQQQLSASQTNLAPGKAQPPTRGGDIAIGNKNPKATAMTLKEVIDAMNAGADDAPKKAAK
jgi:DNA repair exonuclease SbcCD ATPase subunit